MDSGTSQSATVGALRAEATTLACEWIAAKGFCPPLGIGRDRQGTLRKLDIPADADSDKFEQEAHASLKRAALASDLTEIAFICEVQMGSPNPADGGSSCRAIYIEMDFADPELLPWTEFIPFAQDEDGVQLDQPLCAGGTRFVFPLNEPSHAEDSPAVRPRLHPESSFSWPDRCAVAMTGLAAASVSGLLCWLFWTYFPGAPQGWKQHLLMGLTLVVWPVSVLVALTAVVQALAGKRTRLVAWILQEIRK